MTITQERFLSKEGGTDVEDQSKQAAGDQGSTTTMHSSRSTEKASEEVVG